MGCSEVGPQASSRPQAVLETAQHHHQATAAPAATGGNRTATADNPTTTVAQQRIEQLQIEQPQLTGGNCKAADRAAAAQMDAVVGHYGSLTRLSLVSCLLSRRGSVHPGSIPISRCSEVHQKSTYVG